MKIGIAQLIGEYHLRYRTKTWIVGKHQVAIDELCEGMVIATDSMTGSGTKLLNRDTRITRLHIEQILAQHHFDPIVSGIYVHD